MRVVIQERFIPFSQQKMNGGCRIVCLAFFNKRCGQYDITYESSLYDKNFLHNDESPNVNTSRLSSFQEAIFLTKSNCKTFSTPTRPGGIRIIKIKTFTVQSA